jgi:hypothetical protein
MKKRSGWHSPVALGVLIGGLLASTGVFASEVSASSSLVTTTSRPTELTVSTTSSAQGRAFANQLLNQAALPAGAIVSNHLEAPLTNAAGVVGLADLVDMHRTYELQRPVDLASFLRAHRARGATIAGPETMSGSDVTSVTGYQLILPFANRHLSYEQLDYTVGVTAQSDKELRVDAIVVWSPIDTVNMPTNNPVTLTAYGYMSAAQGSSEPTSVILTKSEAQRLRNALSSLSNTAGGMCMEDDTLFTITTSFIPPGSTSSVKWSAIADVCPGVLNVVSGTRHVSLDDHSCVLRALVGEFLPPGRAAATRVLLNSCVN